VIRRIDIVTRGKPVVRGTREAGGTTTRASGVPDVWRSFVDGQAEAGREALGHLGSNLSGRAQGAVGAEF
ncbi:hypothetical protein, partial [Knoellia sinensis]|uniref:hypothetical protein n=1 Tax=Knoellia sinensis TaxID=136100 RepID=UPI00055A3F7A